VLTLIKRSHFLVHTFSTPVKVINFQMLTLNGTICGTKAQTLAALRDQFERQRDPCAQNHGLFDDVIVLDQRRFTIRDWQSQRTQILSDVLRAFADQLLIVRSSAIGEDGANSSLAGAFESLANVAPDARPLGQAINKVIASYGKRTSLDSEVLIQPMATGIVISGVIFSREMNTGANYFVVNYDDFSGKTDTVTSGKSSKVLYIRRSHFESIHSHRFYNLAKLVIYLEQMTECPALDIEFGIDEEDRIYLFQLRPLTLARTWSEDLEKSFHTNVDEAFDHLKTRWTEQSFQLFGTVPLLSDMADWNPAEILGGLPTPLSSSLYHKIITESCWAHARAEMGYLDLTPFDLMVDLCGKQFIDVRLSLNSFLPKDVDPKIADALVEFQIQKVNANRHLHDKLEFEVAITCIDFSTYRRLDELVEDGLDVPGVEAFEDAVLNLTRRHIEAGIGGLEAIIARQKLSDGSEFALFTDPSIYTLEFKLEKLIECGTLPFSILARHGFIGVSFLRSMVTEGMLSDERADVFMNTVETITSSFVEDLSALSSGYLSHDDFLQRYGHLRPGTYDIRSLRYDEAPDFYLSGAKPTIQQRGKFALTLAEREAINAGLERLSIAVTADALIDYITSTIQLRERSKFYFTRHLSNILLSIKTWGDSVGMAVDQLAYARIQDLLDLANSTFDMDDLKSRIEAATVMHQTHRMVRLPAVITEPDDVNVVRVPMGKPNFITHKQCVAPGIFLQTNSSEKLDGHIVLIESADPGFDWLFTRPIAGLVTKYGGSNSHMAIRCAEFQLPAAIGCGDRLFDDVKSGGLIELDCAGHIVRRIR
jgi:hypothetical protein